MTAARPDFLVIGGGIIGLRLALEAKRRYASAAVMLIEKEPALGAHASTRNSGVLHAGFNYTADSLKARFARAGNAALTEYCEERALPIRRCGKLVVARTADDLPVLDELVRRARRFGVPLEDVAEEDVVRIEPRARTHGRALFSPTTSTVDPARVVSAFAADAAAAGVELRPGTAYLGRRGGRVRTTGGPVSAGYVINAAGLYADRIARDFGFGAGVAVLPFRGSYLHADGARYALRTNVYPAPDLRRPFLGVHFTLTAAGEVNVGPTAAPALWREQYAGLRNFRADELLEIAWRMARLLVADRSDVHGITLRELRKRSRRRLLARAHSLLREPIPARWRRGPAGVRAQLLDLRTGVLMDDFRFEGDGGSFHVLNVVSPGLTCAIPFAAYLFDRIEALAAGR